jgi:hypothetical protein
MTTSSKLVTGFFIRITPTGWPVQWITLSFQLQVSGAQFTAAKSASSSARQPRPVPSMQALGSSAGELSAAMARSASALDDRAAPTSRARNGERCVMDREYRPIRRRPAPRSRGFSPISFARSRRNFVPGGQSFVGRHRRERRPPGEQPDKPRFAIGRKLLTLVR